MRYVSPLEEYNKILTNEIYSVLTTYHGDFVESVSQ